MQRIGILLFDDVEELDAVGPWEVFGAWAHAHPDEAEVVAFATRPGPVRAAKGLRLQADRGSLGLLAELDPTIEVRPDDRFVDDGDMVTSAGVSAGIDMALHVLARLAGVERAKEIRRYIQYDPLPPV